MATLVFVIAKGGKDASDRELPTIGRVNSVNGNVAGEPRAYKRSNGVPEYLATRIRKFVGAAICCSEVFGWFQPA